MVSTVPSAITIRVRVHVHTTGVELSRKGELRREDEKGDLIREKKGVILTFMLKFLSLLFTGPAAYNTWYIRLGLGSFGMQLRSVQLKLGMELIRMKGTFYVKQLNSQAARNSTRGSEMKND